MYWNRIIALIIKEFQAIWRDKKSRTILVLPPIVQLFVFAFAATLDVKNATIGVLNRDNGEKSIEFLQRIKGSPIFTHIIYLKSVEEVTPFIDNQRGSAVISIDEQFSRNIDSKHPAVIQLILDGRKSNSTQILTGYIASIVSDFNNDPNVIVQVNRRTTELVPRNWYNPNLMYFWYTVPSLCAILVMLEALVLTAMSVARERELGTFDQLLVSPITSIEILIGKMVPSIVISMIEGTIIILAAVYVFRIPFTGSIFLLYFSMLIFVSSIVGVGLFISSLCNTQQQAILGSSLFMTPSIVLSGFATPIENMPTWLQPFTYFVPLRYFITICKGIFLKSMPWYIVLNYLWPLALIAIFTLAGTTWFFRKRLE